MKPIHSDRDPNGIRGLRGLSGRVSHQGAALGLCAAVDAALVSFARIKPHRKGMEGDS
jgi:hypothetical protein